MFSVNSLKEQLLSSSRVTDLLPVDTKENPYFYTFKVQCTSCRETHPNLVSVSRFVSHCQHALLVASSLPKTGRGRNQMRCLAAGVKPILCGNANPAGYVFVSLLPWTSPILNDLLNRNPSDSENPPPQLKSLPVLTCSLHRRNSRTSSSLTVEDWSLRNSKPMYVLSRT